MAVSSLLRLLFFVFFIIFVDGKCLDDQKKLLLELKSELVFNSSISQCLVKWNEKGDCCKWEGVGCDDSGHVTLLHLLAEGISGVIGESSALFRLTYLSQLDLSYNDFATSEIPNQFQRLTNLRHLGLSHCGFMGPIPSFLSCKGLEYINLFSNNLTGSLSHLHFRGLTNLFVLDLSHNSLNGTITNLRNLSSLRYLDLSNNYLTGVIPSWIWGTKMFDLNLSFNLLITCDEKSHYVNNASYVGYLNLQSNKLNCGLSSLIPSSQVYSVILLANNRLTGVLPTFICNASKISVLDLSFNNLSGSIPPCLINTSFVRGVLNLSGNKINGVIPNQFSKKCGLQTFDVSNNSIVGRVPTSLANCKKLVVVNVGNNNLEGRFPCTLPLSLRILILRANRFHGDLRCGKSWPGLQILDISSNNFSGSMSLLNLSSVRGMMLESSTHLRLNRSNSHFLGSDSYYHNEVTLTVKGIEVKLVMIWPDFTSIDLSSNRFEGEIPDAIGNLSSLYLLNLSHNSLGDAIPRSLGALTELGSLDLSSNKLTGRIPEELAKLNFLSVLNLSYNHLTGLIPTSTQFQTFSASSFEGNPGLSGFPLNGSFNPHPPGPSPLILKDEEEIEWEYVFAASGYVVGIGSVAWTLLCCRSLRERYFEKIEEVADKIFYERGRRKRHERRVRREEKERREERRNGLRLTV